MPPKPPPSRRPQGAGARTSGWTIQHRPVTVKRRQPEGYFALAQRPLHILAFLLPLIILYELGSARHLADAANGTLETIRAHSMLLGFFQDFGLVGRFLPGLALVTVLVVGHLLQKDRWALRPGVLLLMLVEAAVWTVPLMVMLLLVGSIIGDPIPPPAAALSNLLDRSREARLTVAIGAGLYEELVFRMIGMAALHLVLVDLAKVGENAGRWLAVLISAAAFAVYHDSAWGGGGIDWLRAAPFLAAGAYFGMVYLYRGFGVVVGVHALYDVLVLVVRPDLM